MSKAQQRVFLVRAGGDGEDEQYAIENGVAIIGFQEVPSLGGVNDYQWVPEPSSSLITPVLSGFFMRVNSFGCRNSHKRVTRVTRKWFFSKSSRVTRRERK